ncbi:MAG: TRAP transporter small permease [Thermodesulfobacteriota bacterium]
MKKSFLGIAVRILNQVSLFASAMGIVFMVAMLLLTVGDVFLRFVFNRPVLGSVEITEYLMVGTGFLGIAWCAAKGGHVGVDLIVSHFSPRVQAVIDSITCLLSLGVVPLVAWQAFVQAGYAKSENIQSDLLDIPAYPFYLIVGIAYALFSLVLVDTLVQFVTKAVKR